MTVKKLLKFINCSLCDKGKLISNSELWVNVEEGIIVSAPSLEDEIFYDTVDLQNLIVAPGFIDIQINGAFGFDFSCSQDSKEYSKNYGKMMKEMIQTGVTSICPTLPSTFPEIYKVALPILKKSRNSTTTDSLGAHIEGPFLSPQKKGCHIPTAIRTAKDGFDTMIEVYGGEAAFDNISIVTAAPEVEGIMECIPELTKRGVTYSIGHTMATYEEAKDALKRGATMITHLYNAMPQPHHREPGVVGLVGMPSTADSNGLQNPFFGIVADGIHVHPAAVNFAYQTSKDKCILVTDAMMLIGLPNGIYQWEGRFIEKTDNYLHMKGTDTIAGSATDLPQCLRNLMQWSSLDLATAVKCVTNHPSSALGLEKKKGYLNPGCDADLTILDINGNVKQVYKLGNKIFDKK
ncbi:hypothetical protein PACTADRAFT_48884 [Pachysolen tannophilus NRRL Y-2460]|uniref:N-acetylglucosamine-6-phosphate deacetylase n=1 Tax=Pachysolen tannophilus NRRL Y-2460 TaxID=669874 RepID=A0A1E4TZF6_PACTA|nr:hypothetical protein PACTADRAFT_48884 [Pachysolen tannophilus NRRL Y-2460]